MTYTAEILFRLPRPYTVEEFDDLDENIIDAIPEDDVLTVFHAYERITCIVSWDGKPSDAATFVERIAAVLPEGSQFASVKVEKDNDAE